MFRTKCVTISPTWTLSCQRSYNLRRPSPGLCQFRANGSHPLNEADPKLGATFSVFRLAWGKRRSIDKLQAGSLSRDRWAAQEQSCIVGDIYPKSCTSRYCVKLTSSGKCEIIEIAQRRQIWPSDTQRN